jgi:4-carboxymuconolactone decarboxylase
MIGWELTMADERYETLYAIGKNLRAESMGAEWVGESLERAESTEFGVDFQKVVTAVVWGGIWSRPGLAQRDRSLIVIAVLTALGRVSELRKHVPNALRNGCTKEEIDEALIQVAAYAGFPSAVAAYAVAQEALRRSSNS